MKNTEYTEQTEPRHEGPKIYNQFLFKKCLPVDFRPLLKESKFTMIKRVTRYDEDIVDVK